MSLIIWAFLLLFEELHVRGAATVLISEPESGDTGRSGKCLIRFADVERFPALKCRNRGSDCPHSRRRECDALNGITGRRWSSVSGDWSDAMFMAVGDIGMFLDFANRVTRRYQTSVYKCTFADSVEI
jgi:hypothetical protein